MKSFSEIIVSSSTIFFSDRGKMIYGLLIKLKSRNYVWLHDATVRLVTRKRDRNMRVSYRIRSRIRRNIQGILTRRIVRMILIPSIGYVHRSTPPRSSEHQHRWTWWAIPECGSTNVHGESVFSHSALLDIRYRSSRPVKPRHNFFVLPSENNWERFHSYWFFTCYAWKFLSFSKKEC